MKTDVDGAAQRDMWAAALRLALVVSTVAALAVLVGAAGGVAEPAVVLVVMAVGFLASMAQTARVGRPAAHRVTLVAARRRVG